MLEILAVEDLSSGKSNSQTVRPEQLTHTIVKKSLPLNTSNLTHHAFIILYALDAQ